MFKKQKRSKKRRMKSCNLNKPYPQKIYKTKSLVQLTSLPILMSFQLIKKLVTTVRIRGSSSKCLLICRSMKSPINGKNTYPKTLTTPTTWRSSSPKKSIGRVFHSMANLEACFIRQRHQDKDYFSELISSFRQLSHFHLKLK